MNSPKTSAVTLCSLHEQASVGFLKARSSLNILRQSTEKQIKLSQLILNFIPCTLCVNFRFWDSDKPPNGLQGYEYKSSLQCSVNYLQALHLPQSQTEPQSISRFIKQNTCSICRRVCNPYLQALCFPEVLHVPYGNKDYNHWAILVYIHNCF